MGLTGSILEGCRQANHREEIPISYIGIPIISVGWHRHRHTQHKFLLGLAMVPSSSTSDGPFHARRAQLWREQASKPVLCPTHRCTLTGLSRVKSLPLGLGLSARQEQRGETCCSPHASPRSLSASPVDRRPIRTPTAWSYLPGDVLGPPSCSHRAPSPAQAHAQTSPNAIYEVFSRPSPQSVRVISMPSASAEAQAKSLHLTIEAKARAAALARRSRVAQSQCRSPPRRAQLTPSPHASPRNPDRSTPRRAKSPPAVLPPTLTPATHGMSPKKTVFGPWRYQPGIRSPIRARRVKEDFRLDEGLPPSQLQHSPSWSANRGRESTMAAIGPWRRPPPGNLAAEASGEPLLDVAPASASEFREASERGEARRQQDRDASEDLTRRSPDDHDQDVTANRDSSVGTPGAGSAVLSIKQKADNWRRWAAEEDIDQCGYDEGDMLLNLLRPIEPAFPRKEADAATRRPSRARRSWEHARLHAQRIQRECGFNDDSRSAECLNPLPQPGNIDDELPASHPSTHGGRRLSLDMQLHDLVLDIELPALESPGSVASMSHPSSESDEEEIASVGLL